MPDEFETVQWRGFPVRRGAGSEDPVDCSLDAGGQRRRRRTNDVTTAVVGLRYSVQFLDVCFY